MIDEIFNEVHWRATLGLDREGNLTKVLGVDGLISMLA
jgi:hypothetical protein